MKKILITKELMLLPEQLQKRLVAMIGKDTVEIICINQKQCAQLTIVTVVLAKTVTAHEKKLLQNDLFISQLYKQQNVLVCYGAHAVFPYKSDFNPTYIALNMHPKFMVYSRVDTSWRALFQNHYSFAASKQLATLEKYATEVVEQQSKSIKLFLNPLLKTGQYVAVGLMYVQLIRNYLNMLKPLLFADGTSVVGCDMELLVFLKEHHPELYRIFVSGDVDKLYLQTILKHHSGMLFNKEADCRRLIKVFEAIHARFAPKVTASIGKELERLIKPFEGDRVFTRESYEELVREKVAQRLGNGFGVSLIYHIDTRRNNGNLELVLLLVVSAVTPYLEQRMVAEIANGFGNTVKLTVLLHRMQWISKHGYANLPFIYRNITHEQLLFEKNENTHAKFIFPVFEISDGSIGSAQYRHYWDSCLENLQIHWQQLSDAANNQPTSEHVTALCKIFIALCLAVVYRYEGYLPHLQNPEYAWKLLQWAAPDFVRLQLNDIQADEIFILFSENRLRASTENNIVQPVDMAQFGTTLKTCSSLYEHAESIEVNYRNAIKKRAAVKTCSPTINQK